MEVNGVNYEVKRQSRGQYYACTDDGKIVHQWEDGNYCIFYVDKKNGVKFAGKIKMCSLRYGNCYVSVRNTLGEGLHMTSTVSMQNFLLYNIGVDLSNIENDPNVRVVS